MTSGNYSEAIKKFQLAEKVMIKSNDKLELFYVYINFIDYYLKANDLRKAKYYANLCFLQCQHYTDNQMKTLVYNNMGEIEFKQHNYEAAISFFQKTIALPTNFDSGKIRNINAHIGLSKNLEQLKRPVEALRHAKVAQSLANVSGIKQLQFDANNNLAQCYKILKMDRLAYYYLDTAILNLDSAFHEASQTTKAFYETKADLVKVASKMEHLKQQQKKQHIMYLSVIMVLIILITLAFIIYRLQHSKNDFLKELVKKNVEIIEEERRFSMTLQQQILPRKTIRKSGDNEKSETLFNQLTCWLETEKRFTQADLSLELVAKELNTNREYLSRAINDQNIHFNDLINKYRVQEAIQILTDSGKKNAHFKLSYIANKVGFNSNSAFIDAFKKKTGLNPAEFRKNLYASE
jgi:AraC-like DNA-binding protein/tetratricopeptide (TPR) repeat protein